MSWVHPVVFFVGGALLLCSEAIASPAFFFGPRQLDRQHYSLKIEARYFDLTRTHFQNPVYLFAQRLKQLETRGITSRIDFAANITPSLAARIGFPITTRETVVETRKIQISADQYLNGVQRRIKDQSIGDPTLGLSYEVFSSELFDLYIDLGTVVPLHDSPNSNTFPERIPASSGQSEAFGGVGTNIPISRHIISADYRGSFFAGNTAAYLVRKVDEQTYTSGALAPFQKHRLTARDTWQLTDGVAVQLGATWSITLYPALVEQGGYLGYLERGYANELSVRLAAVVNLNQHHQLVLSYEQPFFHSWEVDPFFPIVTPPQGLSASWQFSSY